MNRTKKNILSIIVTLLLTACIGFTVYQIKSQNTPPSTPTGQMQQQTNNQSGSNSSDSSDNNNSSNDSSSKIKLTGDSYVTSLNDEDSSFTKLPLFLQHVLTSNISCNHISNIDNNHNDQ